MASMLNLDVECWATIFSHLAIPDQAACRHSCKALAAAADSESHWASMCRLRGVSVKPKTPWKDHAKRCNVPHIPSDAGVTGGWTRLATHTIEDDEETSTWQVNETLVTAAAEYANASNLITDSPSRSVVIVMTADDPTLLRMANEEAAKFLGLEPASLLKTMPASLSATVEGEEATAVVAAAVDIVDVFPTDRNGAPTVVSVLRVHDEAGLKKNPKVAAKALNSLFHTNSTVVFVGRTEEDLLRFHASVGPALESTPIPAFATRENIPDVIHLVTDDSLEDEGSLLRMLRSVPEEAQRYFDNRANLVLRRPATASSRIDAKPYRVPAWEDPTATCPVPPAALLTMLAGGLVSVVASRHWTRKAMEVMVTGPTRRSREFYLNAMNTEIAELIRATDVDRIPIPKPMDNETLVDTHDHFFYAALRSHFIQLNEMGVRETADCLLLLEVLKRDISVAFRSFYTDNSQTCRAYCGEVYDEVFAAHEKKFGEGDGLSRKNGLKKWFTGLCDKIEEYESKAIGPRRYDVLSERVRSDMIPQIRQRCLEVMEASRGTAVHVADVDNACKELQADVDRKLVNFRKKLDEKQGMMQRNSAFYTSLLGNAWIADAIAASSAQLRRRGALAESFAASRLMIAEDAEYDDNERIRHSQSRQALITRLLAEERVVRESSARIGAQLPADYDADIAPIGNSGGGSAVVGAPESKPKRLFNALRRKLNGGAAA